MKLNKAVRATAWTLAALVGLPVVAVAAIVGFPGQDGFDFLGARGPVEWGVVPRIETCWMGYDENGEWESGGESSGPYDGRVYVLPMRFEDAVATVGAELERDGYFPEDSGEHGDEWRSWTRGDTGVSVLRGQAESWSELMRGRETHTATHVTVYVAEEIAEDWIYHVKRAINELEY